jgi:hypothetical protein
MAVMAKSLYPSGFHLACAAVIHEVGITWNSASRCPTSNRPSRIIVRNGSGIPSMTEA